MLSVILGLETNILVTIGASRTTYKVLVLVLVLTKSLDNFKTF